MVRGDQFMGKCQFGSNFIIGCRNSVSYHRWVRLSSAFEESVFLKAIYNKCRCTVGVDIQACLQ